MLPWCRYTRERPLKEFHPKRFRFLTTPGIEPTNYLTEEAIPHIVIDGHITQGTRGTPRPRWPERVWTTLATIQKQRRDVFEFLCSAINAYFRQEAAP